MFWLLGWREGRMSVGGMWRITMRMGGNDDGSGTSKIWSKYVDSMVASSFLGLNKNVVRS